VKNPAVVVGQKPGTCISAVQCFNHLATSNHQKLLNSLLTIMNRSILSKLRCHWLLMSPNHTLITLTIVIMLSHMTKVNQSSASFENPIIIYTDHK